MSWFHRLGGKETLYC